VSLPLDVLAKALPYPEDVVEYDYDHVGVEGLDLVLVEALESVTLPLEVEGGAHDVGARASANLLDDLLYDGLVVLFHAFWTTVVEVEYVEFGKCGVVEAGLLDDVFEQVVVVEVDELPHLSEDVVPAVAGGADADDYLALCGH